MSNDTSTSTVVTKVTGDKDSAVRPLMSYTAVTSHQEMAEAFVREVVRLGQQIIPDHALTVEDLISICHLAINRKEAGVVMLEGRHLRSRVAEQLSRAERYKEPFSMMVLSLDLLPNEEAYESVVDTLCERMRKTDLMFLFKSRIVLVLPHTNEDAQRMLQDRVRCLLGAAISNKADIPISGLTYPSESVQSKSDVLDWAEDRLRT